MARKQHPALEGLEVGVWHPEAVGKVQGYGATQEAYEVNKRRLADNAARAKAAGRLTRAGVPNGWAGKKQEVAVIRRNAQTAAERLTDILVPGKDQEDPRAVEALNYTFAMALDRTLPPTIRLMVMRIALTFVLPIPSQKAALGAFKDGGLGFLAALSAKLKTDI